MPFTLLRQMPLLNAIFLCGMISSYKVLTITHQHLNVDQLDIFAIKESDDALESKLNALKGDFDIAELQYLSTCNRVSYLMYKEDTINIDFVRSFFKSLNPNLEKSVLENLSNYVLILEGVQAVNHVFELASSMDSLVIGEREIFRQYKESYKHCKSISITGDNLRLLERYTCTTAKQVYSETGIGERPVSIVSLAIKKFMHSNPEKDARILIIGAGETNKLVGKFLKKHGFTEVTIFNRSLDNAKELSELLAAPSFHLSELKNFKKGFDVVCICTAANDVIIDESIYTSLLGEDKDEKVLIDLAVPRNIGKDVTEKYPVNYIDIDGLRLLAEENMQFRKKELVKARKIVKINVAKFSTVYQQRQVEKMLVHVPTQMHDLKDRALNNVYKEQLSGLDDSTKNLIEEMMDYMVKKCISVPMKMAKSSIK